MEQGKLRGSGLSGYSRHRDPGDPDRLGTSGVVMLASRR